MTNRTIVLRSAFWSGRLTYRKWRGIIRRGPREHMRFFVQSFHHLPMDWLLKEIGDERFISIWPEVRKGFDKNSPAERTVLDAWDAIWGVIAVGDCQYPVNSEVARLPGMRREVLKTVVRNPGISIYDIARRLQRDYSRIWKDVRFLAEMGEIELRSDAQSKRRIKRLLPVHSVNAVLINYKRALDKNSQSL